MSTRKILCIYHGGCDDGFAAAWVVRNALSGDKIEFFAGSYAFPPPDVTGRHVIMVDFSYKRPVLEIQKSRSARLDREVNKNLEQPGVAAWNDVEIA